MFNYVSLPVATPTNYVSESVLQGFPFVSVDSEGKILYIDPSITEPIGIALSAMSFLICLPSSLNTSFFTFCSPIYYLFEYFNYDLSDYTIPELIDPPINPLSNIPINYNLTLESYAPIEL